MNAAALTGCLVVVACAAPARVEVGVDAGEPGVGSACVGTWSYHDGLAVLTIGADSGYPRLPGADHRRDRTGVGLRR